MADETRSERRALRVSALILAAGASRRMDGRDKLLEDVGGRPILRAVAQEALASAVCEVLIVLPPQNRDRLAAVAGLDVRVVEAVGCEAGMGASLAAGITALPGETDAVLIMLADMPDVSAGDMGRIIAAYDPRQGREICRAVTRSGEIGHPVLFGRRFFADLAALKSEEGGRTIVRHHFDAVVDVVTTGRSAVTDLDTQRDWIAWRSAREPS
ncbi:MAG: nucleotidyltransferase family protein [Pseudomonadota bacterium]